MKKIKIYYDGACHLCSREIKHYFKLNIKRDNEPVFEFIDIANPKFNSKLENLNENNVQKAMHVRDENGDLHVGVNAFIVIWKNIPQYKFMAFFIKLPIVFQLSKVGYFIFAKIRKFLPKKEVCEL